MNSTHLHRLLRQGLAAIATTCALCPVTSSAAPVTDALDRPALASRRGAMAVLQGAAAAGKRLVAVGERGLVMLSDDQGRTWRQARSVPVSVTLTAVRFPDPVHGFAVGHSGVVLATADAGETWTRQLDGTSAARTALAAARTSGDARSLRDAERLVADGADKPLLDLHFFDSRRGLVVGAYNLAFSTEDGGQTWQSIMSRLDNPKGLHVYALRVRGNTIVLAGESGLVLRSDDAGRTYRSIDTPYKGSWFTLELPGDHEMVLAGLRGNVWRSTDSGASWTHLSVPVPASFTGSALSEGRWLLVNQAGMLFSGQGAHLAPLPGRPLPPLNAVLPLAGGQVLTLGIAGAAVVPPPIHAGAAQ